MVLGCLFGVVLRLEVMTVRHVSVMAGLLVVARFVVFCGRTMVLGRVFVMLGRLAMVVGAFLRHGAPLLPDEN
jgi:hypothetical protein